jgi:hypothetical protein
MSLPTTNDTAGVHEDKFDPEATEKKASPPKKSDSEITNPSLEEATAAPREKASRSKKSKHPPANKRVLKPTSAPKLPFEFADEHFSQAVVAQMANACATRAGLNSVTFGSMASVMFGQKPKDPFELMLMNHMSGLNALIMEHIGRLNRVSTPDGIELHERTLNKLCRTFASYVDVLHRCYRSGSEQRVMVQQNVSVNDGGQAIVANVAQNASAADNKPNSAPAMITDLCAEPMPVIEPNEQPVPVSVKRKPL